MVLVIDNYDSFTYNLVQLLGQITSAIEVRRNDEITLDEVARLAPSHIVLSPGPGRPEDAGITVGAVQRFAPSTPILGVCLG
ncbi:MAG TPA: aminodeoxychorismate/anthranilate synthase component II, partial [Bacteroidota bacterium]|nr:aminodeoxychorismate/anthranilate synthase component II [Bacteroidota bacterium]